MFRMDTKTKDILKEYTPTRAEIAAQRRQKVYKAILKDNTIQNNGVLARAAGFDMGTYGTTEYYAGYKFISRMLRQGYIDKQMGQDGEMYFYVTGKEPIIQDNASQKTEEPRTCSHTEPESLREARENFAKEMAEYKPEIEDEEAEEEKLYSGVLSLGQCGSRGHIEVKFVEKSRAEIIDIISNLNLEDIL